MLKSVRIQCGISTSQHCTLEKNDIEELFNFKDLNEHVINYRHFRKMEFGGEEEEYDDNIYRDIEDVLSYNKAVADSLTVFQSARFDETVTPRCVRLKPKQSKMITITHDPRHFPVKFEKTDIEADLLGYVHLKKDHKFQDDLFYRKSDTESTPVNVKLLTTLELPLLQLQLLQGDMTVTAYASDIIDKHEVQYEKTLIFRNIHDTAATVSMNIEKPFKVLQLSTVEAETSEHCPAILIKPGDCLQVLIECVVDVEYVLFYADALFNNKNSTNFEYFNQDENSVTLEQDLNINQLGVQKQVTKMKFILYYPDLHISQETVNFQLVYIGNTKMALLMLSNTKGTHLHFSIIKSILDSPFRIVPNKGIVPKAEGRTLSTVTLKIYFSPSESTTYHEEINILSNIPFLSKKVTLTGIGTHNEKFYEEGI